MPSSPVATDDADDVAAEDAGELERLLRRRGDARRVGTSTVSVALTRCARSVRAARSRTRAFAVAPWRVGADARRSVAGAALSAAALADASASARGTSERASPSTPALANASAAAAGTATSSAAPHREAASRPERRSGPARGRDLADARPQRGRSRRARGPQLVRSGQATVMVSHPLFELRERPAAAASRRPSGLIPSRRAVSSPSRSRTIRSATTSRSPARQRLQARFELGGEALAERPASHGARPRRRAPRASGAARRRGTSRARSCARSRAATRGCSAARVEPAPLLKRRLERLAGRDPRRPPSSASGRAGSRRRRRGAPRRPRRSVGGPVSVERRRGCRRSVTACTPLCTPPGSRSRVTSRCASSNSTSQRARSAFELVARGAVRGRGRPCPSSRRRASPRARRPAPRSAAISRLDALELGRRLRVAGRRSRRLRARSGSALGSGSATRWLRASLAHQVGPAAVVRAERAVLDRDDPVGHGVEQRAVVRDEEHRPRERLERGLERLAALEVEVVRRLVEDEEVRARRDEQREREPPPLAAGERRDRLLVRLPAGEEEAAEQRSAPAGAAGRSPRRSRRAPSPVVGSSSACWEK